MMTDPKPEVSRLPDGMYHAVVESAVNLTPDIRHLRMRLLRPERIVFHPGQFIRLSIPAAPGETEIFRNYSFANPPSDDGHVELIVRLVPGGVGSGWIFRELQAGSEVHFKGPFGRFAISSESCPMIWVAGGSGMSPFWSMLQHMRIIGTGRPCTYFYGAPRASDLIFLNEMRHMEQELGTFRFVPAAQMPDGNPPWAGEVGLVTEVLARHLSPDSAAEAYLCGPPGLIKAAREVLETKGLAAERIFADTFLGQNG